MNKRRTRGPSPAEIELWRAAMRGTAPLPGRAAPEPAAEPSEPAPPAARRRPVTAASPPVGAPRIPPSKPAPTLVHGRGVGLDRRQAERLRRGRLPIEGRLDLHGMTQTQAHDRLNAFIAAAVAESKRCVLVITGKGLAGGEGAGVLREAVPRWLNAPPLRERVLVFDHAQPRHGGLGALYVLLRRKRDG